MSDTPIHPDHRRLASDLFNHVWTLLDKPARTPAEDTEMIHAAHASRHHWTSAGGPKQFSIGEWQISRVYSAIGRSEPAVYHARLALQLAEEASLAPFYIGYAHESLARGLALAGDANSASSLAAAEKYLSQIEKSQDADALRADLATIPILQPAAPARMKM